MLPPLCSPRPACLCKAAPFPSFQQDRLCCRKRRRYSHALSFPPSLLACFRQVGTRSRKKNLLRTRCSLIFLGADGEKMACTMGASSAQGEGGGRRRREKRMEFLRHEKRGRKGREGPQSAAARPKLFPLPVTTPRKDSPDHPVVMVPPPSVSVFSSERAFFASGKRGKKG